MRLPYLALKIVIECVDDVASRRYSEIMDRRTIEQPDWNSSEKMREAGKAYRWGVVVSYSTPRVAKRGSCIFLHIGGEGGRGTSGCTAMAPELLHGLMGMARPRGVPVLVQLPHAAYEALQQPWALP